MNAVWDIVENDYIAKYDHETKLNVIWLVISYMKVKEWLKEEDNLQQNLIFVIDKSFMPKGNIVFLL